jgi:hypothetical protein
MEQNLTTIGTTSQPILLKRSLANHGDKLLLKGKVLNKATSFKIEFVNFEKKNFNKGECLVDGNIFFDNSILIKFLASCKIVLFLDVEFENRRTEFGAYEKNKDTEMKEKIPTPSNAKFEKGKDFQIEVIREDKGFKLVYGDGNMDFYEFKEEAGATAKFFMVV